MNLAPKTAVAFRWTRSYPTSLLVVALGLAVAAHAAPVRASSLDRELVKHAPQVVKFLQDQGYKNVGVLKFRIKKGTEKVTDNVGPLNAHIASRLEVALVLANDFDEEKQLKIIQNASAVAAGIKGASHMTSEGRKPLFQGTYPLAWGTDKVKPDAFVTGTVQIAASLREMTVRILVYPKDKDGYLEIDKFTVATDVNALIQAGESFDLRAAFGRKKTTTTKEVAHTETKKDPHAETAAVVHEVKKAKDEKRPLTGPPPVELEVYYNGQRVSYNINNDGKAEIPEPKEGQNVYFVLRRKDQSSQTYGVVLMVNGENTLDKQKRQPIHCRRWILDPNDPPIMVKGYQVGDDHYQEFKISSLEESKQNEIKYGADVGTISFTVFQAANGKPKTPDLGDEDPKEVAAVGLGELPKDKPADLDKLKSQLRGDGDGLRGLIEGGATRSGASVTVVKFVPDPNPVCSLTIYYYRPQDLPK